LQQNKKKAKAESKNCHGGQPPFFFPTLNCQSGRHAQRGPMFQEVRKGSLGRILASLIIAGTVEGVEKTKVCPDGVSADLLFAAGAFHTCAAIGKQNESTSYIRTLTCWGWHDSGQANPPDIDHITGVAAGARHSCATNRDRVAKCWGSNVHGQLDIPRHFDRTDQINYCSLGRYRIPS
jgi:hypothetical protein